MQLERLASAKAAELVVEFPLKVRLLWNQEELMLWCESHQAEEFYLGKGQLFIPFTPLTNWMSLPIGKAISFNQSADLNVNLI